MSDKPVPEQNNIIINDTWESLKDFTAARIAQGRTGVSLPLKKSLEFRMAHALARDAVYSSLRIDALAKKLSPLLPVIEVQSQAQDRIVYLQRPDLGRKLNEDSVEKIKEYSRGDYVDVALIVADGLSATAINEHATPLLEIIVAELNNSGLTTTPITLVEQGRVAIADEIGFLFNAKLAVILIAERPGLSATDSVGIYLTYDPKPGKTDEARNCISNIRPRGLSYAHAAAKLVFLIQESLRLKLSGVNLKDTSGLLSDRP
jgi:ethanolamine ammonia-lyase small subunit